MSIKLLNENDKKIVLDYINRNSLETTFLYGNVVHIGLKNDNYKRRCANYYGYFEEGRLRGILPFYNLGSCIPHYETVTAVPYFIDIMKKKKFQYLLGMKSIVYPLYNEIKNVKYTVSYEESSYFINENFKPFKIDNASFINARTGNKNIIEFIKLASKDGFENDKSTQDVIKTLNERGIEEDFILLSINNTLVAQANIQTFTPAINQIGGVYTKREFRGKGYCKVVVSEICRRIIHRGKVPTLLVKKNNIPALKAYQALGFKHYKDYLLIGIK